MSFELIYIIGMPVFGLIGATLVVRALLADKMPPLACVAIGACAAAYFGLGWIVMAPGAILAYAGLLIARRLQ